MIPIEQLITPITADALFDVLLGMLESIGVPARSWRQGGVARTILGAIAQVGSQGSFVVADICAGMFLFFAKNQYLTAHAKDIYDVDRLPATFASGPVTITNTAGGSYGPFGANELVVHSSNVGARFKITEAVTILPGSTSTPFTVTVNAEAFEAGSASTVAPAEIDELETPLRGVAVANATSLIGRDAEPDAKLKERCLAKKGTWSPFGPRDAYVYAALTATLDDGSPTNITRVSVSRFSSTGQVTVVCATPTGTPTSLELDAVRKNVEAIARPDTVTVTTSGATTVATTHSVIVWCSGGNLDLITQRAEDALAAFIAQYPIGGIHKVEGGPGYLWSDAVAAAIIGSSKGVDEADAYTIFDVDFVPGAVDIPLTSGQVATNTTTFDVRVLS